MEQMVEVAGFGHFLDAIMQHSHLLDEGELSAQINQILPMEDEINDIRDRGLTREETLKQLAELFMQGQKALADVILGHLSEKVRIGAATVDEVGPYIETLLEAYMAYSNKTFKKPGAPLIWREMIDTVEDYMLRTGMATVDKMKAVAA